MKKTLLAMSILLGLLGFSACGEASNRTVYQYRETEVFQNFYVKKAVYTPGELKLYYRGGAFKDNTVRCYGADFEDLGDAFAYTFQNGVLTIRADFAEQISGLMIDDPDQSVRYRLRYLDSSQFASLTDIFWRSYRQKRTEKSQYGRNHWRPLHFWRARGSARMG